MMVADPTMAVNCTVAWIAAGTALRFEPGQTRDVTLVPYRGLRIVQGFRALVMGALD